MNLQQQTVVRNQPDPRPDIAVAGLVFNLMHFSLHDGPGIRTTVFLKGCPLRCRWCHNPESQSPKPEILYNKECCVRCGDCARACPNGALRLEQQLLFDSTLCQRCGACADACLISARQLAGHWMTVPEVMAEVLKDQVFFDESGGGVTLSGGEPLFQPVFAEMLLAACQARGIRTTLDTSGFADSDVLRRVSKHVDLFLYDLKVMDSKRHQRFTGVKNELILQNLKMLAELGRAIIVRVPLIPGVNDDNGNFDAMTEFLTPLGLRNIDLLPYHKLGIDKYPRLQMPSSSMEEFEPPTTQQMELIAARLKRDGFTVRIGG